MFHELANPAMPEFEIRESEFASVKWFIRLSIQKWILRYLGHDTCG